MPGQHHTIDELYSVLEQLEAAVDAVCSDDPLAVARAAATLNGLANRHPALVMAYQRTLVCVARVRSRLAEGPALLALLQTLGLSGQPELLAA